MKTRKFTQHGITFTRAEVVWEDAFKVNKQPIGDVLRLLKRSGAAGPSPSTFCYYAKVGSYLVLVQEYEPATDKGDFTIVPLRPRIKIERA